MSRRRYRPVIGGVRHRMTDEDPAQPAHGTIVQTLCGALYKVGYAEKSDPESDCPTCEEESER